MGFPEFTFSFTWNCKTPLFSDKRVRKAMSYAFDHDEMLNNLLYALDEPGVGNYHPSVWYGPKDAPQPYKQDLTKAEALLDEAGWSDHDGNGIRDKSIGGRSVPFEFNILTMNVPDRIKICELLKENLDRIGIQCNVQSLEFTTLQERLRLHQFQATFGGWGSGADPDTAENIYATNEGRNFGEYSNPEVDRLFKEGKKEFDREKRAEIYRQIHAILWEDQPYTWLYHRKSMFAFNKNLRGYVFSQRGPYHYGPGFFSIWMPAL
jgi:peptide/nickel transport system substrate-binding protein